MSPLFDDRPGHEYDDDRNWYKPGGDNESGESGDSDATTTADTASDQGTTKKSLSDDELAAAEGGAKAKKESGNASDDPAGEDEGLYKPSKKGKKQKARITRKQGITGGIAGILLTGILGTLSITSGPLKIIHMAEQLKTFHFLNQEDAGSDRMAKIARFIRGASPERTRLGKIGNLYADHVEKRMNKSGIESSYDKFGNGDGYVIDPATVPSDSELGEIMNKDWGTHDQAAIAEKVRGAIAERYGLDPAKISVDGDKLNINSDDLGYFKNRKFMKAMMGDAGMDGLGAAMRTRIMGKRAGISWHPIKKLDKKVLKTIDERYTKWREDRQQRLDDGDTSVKASDPKSEDADGDGSPDEPTEDAKNASAETHSIEAEAQAADTEIKTNVPAEGGSSGPLHSLRTSTSMKIAGGITAAVGIVCMIKGLSDNFDNIKYANLVLPMMRAGMEFIAVAGQIQAGQDVDLEQLSFYTKQLYQAEEKRTNTTKKGTVTEDVPASSAFSARSIQAERGEPLTGADLPDEARLDSKGNFIGQFVDKLTGIDKICDVANSLFGQIASLAVDVISGPFSAAVGFAFGQTIAPKILDKVVNWLAGHPLDILNVSGAPYGNILNYGARLASNDSFMAAGGRPLTGTETAQLKEHQIVAARQDLQSESFATRMFSPYEANSLVSQLIDKQSPTMSGNLSNMAIGILDLPNLLTSPIKLIGHLFNSDAGAAAAASSYDYGFPEFGFSESELNNKDFDNPFTNSDRAMGILQGSNGDKYISRAKKCFGVNLTKDNSPITSEGSVPHYTDAMKNDSGCSDTSSDWTSIRFYIFDTQMMEAQACYEGGSDSCTNIGFRG